MMSLLSIIWLGCTKASPSTSSNLDQASTYVLLMDMAPFSPSAEIYLNDTKSTSPVAPGTYATSYSHLVPGAYDVKFKVAGSDSILAELASSAYDSMSFYTLIMYNADTISKSVQALKVLDDFSQINSGATYWRLFDLCPGLPAVDVYLNGNMVMKNRASADIAGYATQYTQFQGMSPNAYSIQVKKAGTDTILATLGGANFLAGNAYTVFLSGSANNANFPISLNLIQATY